MAAEKVDPDHSKVTDSIPKMTHRNDNAEVDVNIGEMFVLGGITTKYEGQSEAGVPLLSKIPLLG